MSDISKLTVAKLKSLCKEKGLTNYSKLSKPALLEKLGVAGPVVASDTIHTKSSNNTKEKDIGKKSATDLQITSPLADTPAHSSASTSTTGSLSANIFLQELDLEPHTYGNATDKLESSFPVIGIADFSLETVDLSASGSKRSADAAFPNIAHKPPQVPKRLKKADDMSGSSTFRGFKIPDIPRREVESPSPSCDRGVCVTQPTESASRVQSYTPSLLSPLRKYSLFSSAPVGQAVTPVQSTFPQRAPATSSTSMTCMASPTVIQGSALLVPPPPSQTNTIYTQFHPRTRVRFGLSHFNSIQSHNQCGLDIPSDSLPSTSVSYHLPPPCRPHKSRFVPPRPTSNTQGRLQCEVTTPLLTPQPDLVHGIVPVPQPSEVAIVSNLTIISIPPSLSQRKRLPMLSLALIWLNDADRKACVLVSKLLRYAVYASAQNILRRWFSGQRLSSLIDNLVARGHSLTMINLWPYLRLRQHEVLLRKKMFEESWVSRFFRGLGFNSTVPISDKIWTSPDHHEQFSVSFRFIQTRICFALSHRALGNTAFKWVTSRVVDAQQVLENEIWSITAVSSDTENTDHHPEETFYVLYQTCEAIGHPPTSRSTSLPGPQHSSRPPDSDRSGMSCFRLRTDWSSYITLRLPTATRHLYAQLKEHIRGTNTDDFDRGVARVWLKRMNGEGEEGELKKKVAERYIIGCVVGNSVSGEYRSTAQMALDFSGTPEVLESHLLHRDAIPKVNLFVPERHNVESVHLTTSGGLHKSLAVVQTAGRQEGTFILRENGVVIGEDEKVPEVWMELLRCSETGVAL